MMMFQNVFAAVSIFLTTTASFNLLRSKLRGIGGSGGEETPAVAKDEPDAGVVIGDTVSLRTKPLDDTADVDKEDKATPPPDTTTIEAEPVLLSSRGVTEIIRQQQQLVQKLTQVQQELEITKTDLTTNRIEVGKLKRLLDDQEEAFTAKWRERESEYARIQLHQKQESIKKADEMEMWQSELSKLRSEAISIRDAISRVRSRSPSARSASSASTYNSKRNANKNKMIIEEEDKISSSAESKDWKVNNNNSVEESDQVFTETVNGKQKKGSRVIAVEKSYATDESVGSPGRSAGTLKSIGNNIHNRSSSRGKSRQKRNQNNYNSNMAGDSLMTKSFPGPTQARGRTPTRAAEPPLSILEESNSI